MSKYRQIYAIFVSSVVMLFASITSLSTAATAAPSGTGEAFKISPVSTPITVPKGTTKRVTVYITNETGLTENLNVLMNDFTAKDTTGAPALYLNNQDAPQHSLRQYTTLSTKTLSVQPGQQASVDAIIDIPSNAVAGGYFGAVRFTPSANSGNSTVNLSGSVASLILVTVPGNYKESVSVSDIHVAQNGHIHSFFRSPNDLQVVVTFANSGDVQEQPFGKVQLQKGKTILSSSEINNTDPRGNVLPASSRTFSVKLEKVGSFGKYTVSGNFGYGSKGQLVSASTTFYVFPLWVVIVALIIIALIILLAVLIPRMMRRHDQQLLRRANRR